jgi:hypothetical protein
VHGIVLDVGRGFVVEERSFFLLVDDAPGGGGMPVHGFGGGYENNDEAWFGSSNLGGESKKGMEIPREVKV